MKTCNKCKALQPLSSFNKKKSSKDGYSTICRACTKVQRAANLPNEYKKMKEYVTKNFGCNKFKEKK